MPSYRSLPLADPLIQSRRESAVNGLGTANADHPKIKALRAIVPFDFYALSGVDYPGLGVGAGVMLASDMPQGFLQRFLSEGLFALDPMSYRVSPQSPWGSWHDLNEAERRTAELGPIRVLEDAYGITTRSVIALYRGNIRFGGATFTRRTPFDDKERFILEAATRMIHAELSFDHMVSMARHAHLTNGEIACLGAVAKGLTGEDAAKATGFTSETLATYIKSATRKLGAVNRTHAVAEALRRKLID